MAESGWLDADEQRIFRAFAHSARALIVQLDRELQASVELPRTYFEILWLLDRAPKRSLRMSDLAAATGSQPSRISYAVGRLEAAGQVRRELDAADRRGWNAVLTDGGRRVLRVAAPRYAEIVRRHFLAPLAEHGLSEEVAQAGELLLARLEEEGTMPLTSPPTKK